MNEQLQKAIKFYEQGNALYQKGKLAESEQSFRKAIKINRDFAEAHGNLGNILKELGRLKEAAGAYRKALKIYPSHPLLLNNLGSVLHLLGESHKAIKYIRDSIDQKPDYADAHNNLGNVLKELGQVGEAVDCYHKALSIKSEFAEAHNNLGNAFSVQGKAREAIASYQRALEINPNYKEACSNLGVALQEQDMLEDAIALHRHVLEMDSKNKETYNNLGIALKEQGKLEEAICAFQGALAIDPNHKEAHHNLGVALRAQGKFEAAITHVQRALKIDPEYAEALRSLSFLKKHTEYDRGMRTMEALIVRKNLSDQQRMHLGFGLGKAFEDIKVYDKAFDFLLEANRLKRATFEYSVSETREFFEKIKTVFSPDFLSSHPAGCSDDTPVFILGMPRSGTSLVEQILASHPQVFGAGELKVLSNITNKWCADESGKKYPDCMVELDGSAFKTLGEGYIKEIRQYSKTANYITDKMPHNFIYIGLIKAILPNAKIIHCVRDPMDNCLSIFKNHFGGPHNYAYELRELGEYYSLYRELMEHMEKHLPGFMYELSYEALVSDQVNQTRQLLEYCGLPWDDSCLSFHKTSRTVATISATQVRRAMYKDSVQLSKRYEAQLEPLRIALQGMTECPEQRAFKG